MALSELEQKVLAKIEELEPELIKVALDLGDIDTSDPNEKIACDYVFQWFKANGFEVKKLGAPDRFNVLGKYKGTGGGRSLVFCSHLDNESREQVEWRLREPDLPIYTHAWRDGDSLVGHGIANDRGPMACWMLAGKAIKDAGIALPGDLLLGAVIGECAGGGVDEYSGLRYEGRELGARFMATHGGRADFALIAEATNFAICPTECGVAMFKVTVYTSPCTYTPFFPYPEPDMAKSVSAIVRMAKFIERFQQYAVEYMKKHSYSFEGGDVVPKVVIGAIRGGVPFLPYVTPEVCSVYMDFKIPAGKEPLELQHDLEGLLKELGMDGKVELFFHLPGTEAWKVKNYDIFKQALTDSHTKVFNAPPPKRSPTYMNSMWRDINPYNQLGVPAITYSFPTGYSIDGAKYDINLFRVKIKDMVDATKVYALLALDLCSKPV
ncbi:MAG: peptidase dimerization domain-containing protein [Chloroflexi bacterium]|nr:peptidase dimerization domain-containing protein [Chloroflexota bacterium]